MSDAVARVLYVISDLHLGGRPPDPAVSGDIGDRIFSRSKELVDFLDALTKRPAGRPATELVINGDFVDFLAEHDPVTKRWSAIKEDPARAVETFETIVGRERAVFVALAGFLGAGHRLTLLPGNHDIELTFPAVRRALRKELGAEGRDFQFLYDGEAYPVGDVLIEHGNRYDKYNTIDHDALRRVRSFQSRRQVVPTDYRLSPCPGSDLVAMTINPLKTDYPFINLLKPEVEALFAVLLALDPSLRSQLRPVLDTDALAYDHQLLEPLLPVRGGEIAAAGLAATPIGGDLAAATPSGADHPGDRLDQVLGERMGPENFRAFQEAISDEHAVGGDIASGFAASAGQGIGLLRLMAHRKAGRLEKRMPALLQAVRLLQDDRTFDRTAEPPGPYRDAAVALGGLGFKLALFGHTHLARDVTLEGGCRYLNTGTWADLLAFPSEVVSKPRVEALAGLYAFVKDLADHNYGPYLKFIPTYARLNLADDGSLVPDSDETPAVQRNGLHVFTEEGVA